MMPEGSVVLGCFFFGGWGNAATEIENEIGFIIY